MIDLSKKDWHYDEKNAKVVVKPWGQEI